MKKPNIDKVKASLRTKGKPQAPPKAADYLSTGSTLLNLACSGRTSGGLLRGHFYLLVGDSKAGKTWLGLELLANAANDPSFHTYRLIHDNPERGAQMALEDYFGRKLVARLKTPSPKGCSRTIEEFYDNVRDAIRSDKPFVYVLDSEDALDSEADLKKSSANKTARKKLEEGAEAEVKGTYGTAKAKANSNGLRMAHGGLGDNGSILVMIKQTRDNVGPSAMFGEKKTRSGGRALTFYATSELWFSVRNKLTRKLSKYDRTLQTGAVLRVQVKKNRLQATAIDSVDVNFVNRVGFDEVGSCVQWLVDWKRWIKSDKGIIEAKELGLSGTLEKLVREIEDKGLERDLRLVVAETWKEIEEACTVTRKRRYE